MCADFNTTTSQVYMNVPNTTPSFNHSTSRNEKAKNNNTTANCHHPHENAPYESATGMILSSVMEKAGGSEGLANMPEDILRQIFEPVKQSLEQLDAESLLDLKRVHDGARLNDSINVQPIHNQVFPRYEGASLDVRYLHVSEVPEKYRIGIFVFPPFSRIPLHDHPGMCVLSRVLYGDLQCLSLDLVREQEQGVAPTAEADNRSHSNNSTRLQRQKQEQPMDLPPGSRKALKNHVNHLHAPSVTISYPYERNLHEFFAGPEGAAVLDILLPPYNEDFGRDCTFYDIHEVDYNSTNTLNNSRNNSDADSNGTPEEEWRKCWVYPIDQPEEFHCFFGNYGKFCRPCPET